MKSIGTAAYEVKNDCHPWRRQFDDNDDIKNNWLPAITA